MNKWKQMVIVSAVAMGISGASWVSESGSEVPYAANRLEEPSTAIQKAREAPSVVQASYGDVQEEWIPPAGLPFPSGEEQELPAGKPLPIERVNGLSVEDDLKTLYELKGEPLSIETDPLFKDERIFVYGDIRVGLYENFIQYVMVPAENQVVEIDGRVLPMNLTALREALGEPDLEADDGLVYQRGHTALKLFISGATGELTSVQLFHSTSA